MPGMTHRWEPQIVQIGTWVMLNVMVYSAVIVMQMMKMSKEYIHSPRRLLRLSCTNNLNQKMVLRNLFPEYYIMHICIDIILSLGHILCILYIILYVLYMLSYQIQLFCYVLIG